MVSWLASLLGKLLPGLVVDATTRLVQAARESLRPSGEGPAERPEVPIPAAPPPIGESGAREASEYLRGYGDAKWARHMDERNAQAGENLAKALDDDDEARAQGIEQALEPEKPSHEQPESESGEDKQP
jgi:hypothetical protein